jgi:hypothetical protein
MELAVALALRTQAILSRDIIHLLATCRPILRPNYRRAWLERETQLGAPRPVTIDGSIRRRFSGVYLDLSLTYSERGVLLMHEPRLLDPVQALDYYMAHHRSLYPRPPLPLSQYAEDIVRMAEGAPEIKRGRKS